MVGAVGPGRARHGRELRARAAAGLRESDRTITLVSWGADDPLA